MASKFRILMFPWLGHAHVFPYLELAKKLSNKNFQIFFCSTSINLNSIKNILQNDSTDNFSIELVDLHLPSMPELPPQYHTTKNTPPHLLPLLIKAFQMSSLSFSDLMGDLNPHLLIYDGFQPWSAKIASSKSIPSVFFSASGSTSLSFFHHLYSHGSCETFPSKAIRLEDNEMKSLFAQGESIEIKDKGAGFLYGVFDLSCEIVLIKSCRVLEGKYLDHLSTLCGKATISTGPLIMLMSENQENDEIMSWLDKKRKCSTLYISFGSENYLSKEQIGEIAKGLEFSNVDFIWVVRSPPGSDVVVEESLPEGYFARVKDRGIVLQKWAPQTAILAHGNVGGYLSHCGWSSIVESLYFAVPVVAMPLQSDHPVNARMVVEAGVGVEVMRDDINGGFDAKGVAKAIKKVFVEKSGEGLRRKAREMSEKMKMEEEEAIDEVAKELLRICMKR